jgi:hypothetical protein
MVFVLLVAALALAGVGAWVNRRAPLAGQAMMGLAGLGLIAVIVWQVRQNVFQPQPTAPNRYEMAVSYALANCLLEDLAGQSGEVVLLFPGRRDMDEHSEESYEDGFLPPLRHGRGRLDLKAIHLEGATGDLSAFKQALMQSPEAIAVVSYAGVPADFENLIPAGKTESPLWFVFDGDGTTHWLGALKSGRIRAVVVPRPDVDARAARGIAGMPDTIFDRFYVLATPANAEEIAATLKPQPGLPQ